MPMHRDLGVFTSKNVSFESFIYSVSMGTPIAFAYELEDDFLATAHFEMQLKDLLAY